MPQRYGHRHSLSSDGGVHEYHDLSSYPAQHAPMHRHDQAQQQQQPPGVQMLQRTNPGVAQHPYYATEQNNPGVVTMNSPHPSLCAMQSHYYHQVPRQGVEPLPLPCSAVATKSHASQRDDSRSFNIWFQDGSE